MLKQKVKVHQTCANSPEKYANRPWHHKYIIRIFRVSGILLEIKYLSFGGILTFFPILINKLALFQTPTCIGHRWLVEV